ncbi:MAG: DUF2721 domain-containing protein [Rhizobacter sp.]|nr:DUF2721 domain-containing protein [Rhizobacter sp.]
MSFQFKDVMAAVGPAAGLMFASWLFLSFLGQRYVAAFERYRSLVDEYRQDPHGQANGARHDNVGRQIALYRRRCDQMRWATTLGLVSSILLVAALIFGVADVVVPKMPWIQLAGTAAAVLGLGFVIAASGIVLAENGAVRHALDDEVQDLERVQPGAPDPHQGASHPRPAFR